MRNDIIQAALSWVDTPYQHQQRLKGVAVDCAQLIAGVAIEVGLIPADTKITSDYTRDWAEHNRESLLVQELERFGCKPVEEAQPGDILCFKYAKTVGHLGILISPTQMVHARLNVGKVVVNTLDDSMRKRIVLAYAFPYTESPS